MGAKAMRGRVRLERGHGARAGVLVGRVSGMPRRRSICCPISAWKEELVALETRNREYDDRSMDTAGALDHFEHKVAFTTGPVELKRAIENGEVTVVDVRREADYRAGHIPGAVNLPEDRSHTCDGLAKHRPNVLMCYSIVCQLAAHAAVEFARAGYPVMELDGGWKEWQRHNLPIER